MNSKVLMVVALLFAGSVSATPDGVENVTLTGKTWFGDAFKNWNNPFKKEVVKPTRFARLKEVVSSNRVATGVAVVATVAVIAAAVVYANSANEVVSAEEEEIFFA